VIEAEVHSSLRDFIREQQRSNWPHHLTMARLVARALRLGRSALIQTGSSFKQYCLSYLTPILLGDWSVIIVTPHSVQKYLLEVEIPRLKAWLKSDKPIQTEEDWHREGEIKGLLLLSPEVWLNERLFDRQNLPNNLLTIIDRADDLEEWTRERLTVSIESQDWDEQIGIAPQQTEAILAAKTKLTQSIWQHPPNPYQCYLLERSERDLLEQLLATLASENLLTDKMSKFWHFLSGELRDKNQILWVAIARELGQFTLKIAPISVAEILSPIWQQQPVVLIGSFLDREASAPIYRQQLGIEEILCLKFSPNRQTEYIQLYLPDRFPLPNTPQFQGALSQHIRLSIELSNRSNKFTVVLVGDVPLKAQLGATLAAEFGSIVRVENVDVADNGVLVSGWEFWRLNQDRLPKPHFLIIATLPLPSLENPLVAARVAYYKHLRQDWFRLYLLPTALRELQQAVLPLRESPIFSQNSPDRDFEPNQSLVALLDNRVNHRSYGNLVLTALEPYARINYIDPSWFNLD
jgi:ATP-dependent DNA helicase DinG